MSNFKFIVCVALIVLFYAGLISYNLYQPHKLCDEQGGKLFKNSQGYVCIIEK